MMDEISLLPSRSPVTAVTVTSLVMSVPELVMNCLEPLITHVAIVSFAVVLGGAGIGAAARLGQAEARPVPGRWPASGSHSCFCASVPNR